jgi:cohesin complex subunit SCC1
LSEDEHSEKSPRLEGPEDAVEDEAVQLDDARPLTPAADDLLPHPMSEGPAAVEDIVQSEDDEGIHGGDDTFDDTTMPLIHPADSGPISLGTKHAVHLLRDRLGDADGAHPSSPARKSVLLQNLVPEGRTSKEDATKMFFEVLVLATKDAIKVDQGDTAIGLPLRIRAKRGLWGSWAETSPGDDPTPNTASQQVAAAA